jgi:hypothetical protein
MASAECNCQKTANKQNRNDKMSIDTQMNLATTRTGRVVLHLMALMTDRKLRWHTDGILRELNCVTSQ